MMTGKALVLVGLAPALFTACTSVPESIRRAPVGAPTLAEARADPQRVAGSPVRWGGTIAEVENLATKTWLVIVARPLASDGKPRQVDSSDGRFIASVPSFLDPVIYAEKRSITVAGRLTGTVERPIGEFSYTFPLMETENHYLWPERHRNPHDHPTHRHHPWSCFPHYRHAWGPIYCW